MNSDIAKAPTLYNPSDRWLGHSPGHDPPADIDHVWERVHVTPRQTLFAPASTRDDPDRGHVGVRLCAWRKTVLCYDDGTHEAIVDDWTNPDVAQFDKGRNWTGDSLFFTNKFRAMSSHSHYTRRFPLKCLGSETQGSMAARAAAR